MNFSGEKIGVFALYHERTDKFIYFCSAQKPPMKGGHRHRRNWAVCSYCGKWHRNKKAFDQGESKWYGKISLCSYPCAYLAEGESFYGETGEPWEPHFFND